jgi:hypothetical protein
MIGIKLLPYVVQNMATADAIRVYRLIMLGIRWLPYRCSLLLIMPVAAIIYYLIMADIAIIYCLIIAGVTTV